jgi:hypothetical protein
LAEAAAEPAPEEEEEEDDEDDLGWDEMDLDQLTLPGQKSVKQQEAEVRRDKTEMRILLLRAAKKGTNVLFCMPNRAKCILLVLVMGHGASPVALTRCCSLCMTRL